MAQPSYQLSGDRECLCCLAIATLVPPLLVRENSDRVDYGATSAIIMRGARFAKTHWCYKYAASLFVETAGGLDQ